MRMWVQSLASLSGLRIRHRHELWCRSQTRLRPHVAVAVAQAGSCSLNLTPSLGTSICHRCGHKKKKKILAQRRPNIKPDLKGDISTLILVYTYATRGCPFIEETTWLQPDPLPTPNRVSWDGVTDSLFWRLKVHFWVHMGFFFWGGVFLRPYPWHMKVPRLRVELELQLPTYTTATAALDPSHICNLHHS